MQPPTSHVGDIEDRVPRHLALYREVPEERFGVLVNRVLVGQRQWELIHSATARIVDTTVRYRNNRLERRIASEENGIAHAETAVEAAAARAKNGLVIHLPGDSEPGLNLIVVNVRIVIRKTMEQAIVLAGGCEWDAAFRAVGPAAARNHDAVIRIASAWNNKASLRILLHRLGRIVERRVKRIHIAPERVERNVDGVASAVVNGQARVHFPGILREHFPHAASERRIGTLSDFGVHIEKPEGGVCDAHSRCSAPARPGIAELEPAILVVG